MKRTRGNPNFKSGDTHITAFPLQAKISDGLKNDKAIGLWVSKPVFDILNEKASARGLTKNDIIREAIYRMIEAS